jgi:hypothetical protein
MNEIELNRPRLAHVLEGFPVPLVSPNVLAQLESFYLDIDALGRIDEETGDPLIDEVTLIAMLRKFVSTDIADSLVAQLKALPGCAFRVGLEPGRLTEASWFELASKVVIFDVEPNATFAELGLAASVSAKRVVKSVQYRFPSLEEEMLDPAILAPQVIKRLEDPHQAELVLRTVTRQLGWWSALVTVLLLPPAISALRQLPESGQSVVAWPLSMNVLAAAVGGWTLTVIGSCLLAPLQ